MTRVRTKDWYEHQKTLQNFRGENFDLIEIKSDENHSMVLTFRIPKEGRLYAVKGQVPLRGGPILELIEKYKVRASVLGFRIDREKETLQQFDPETLKEVVNALKKSGSKFAPEMGIATYDGAQAPVDIFAQNLRLGLFTIASGDAGFMLHDFHSHFFTAMLLPKPVVDRIRAEADFYLRLKEDRELQKNSRFMKDIDIYINSFVGRWEYHSYTIQQNLALAALPGAENHKRAFKEVASALGLMLPGNSLFIEQMSTEWRGSFSEVEKKAFASVVKAAKVVFPWSDQHSKDLAEQLLKGE